MQKIVKPLEKSKGHNTTLLFHGCKVYRICYMKRIYYTFCKKAIYRNFEKSTGKQLCQSLFFNKGAGLRPVTL